MYIRRKIILDCDPGMDDSMSIVLAAKLPDLPLCVAKNAAHIPADRTIRERIPHTNGFEQALKHISSELTVK